MKPQRVLTLVPLLAFAAVSSAALTIGDKAPALKVTDWVKGSPVELGKGKPVVVEFWATWCGPCKQSIPHLTDLAKKYAGKVDFVGVSVWESAPGDYKTKVPAMVKEFGAKMDYNVATEGPDTFMAKNWMTAAGENGIPTAFLIDANGTVAWIGHPMDGLDESVDALLAGKLDIAGARTKREESKKAEVAQMAKQQAMQKKLEPVLAAYRKKDFKAGVSLCDQLWRDMPSDRMTVANIQMMGMVQGKLGGFDTFFEKLGKLPEMKNPMAINQFVWPSVENPGLMDANGYKAAVKLCEKMMALDPKNWMNMDTYALSLWRAGDKAKARIVEKKALDLGKADKHGDAATLQEMEARLKSFGV